MPTTTAPPVPVLHEPWGIDARLHSLLHQSAGDIAVSPRQTARTEVRRRLVRLHRRRRVRHTLGSSTLAASVLAGGLQLRNDGRTGSVAPSAAAEAAAPLAGPTSPPATAPAPTEPVQPAPTTPAPGSDASSWSWDPDEGIDRVAADPGALLADGTVHVYTTTATHCSAGACRTYWVPRFTSPTLNQRGRLDGDAMPDRPRWVASDDRALWAPSVVRIGDSYVLYFAATSGQSDSTSGMKCLGAAVSPTPEGPFVPLPDPLHCTPGYWAIDPYPVRDGDRWYLLWRQDDRDNVTGTIVAAPLRSDGLALTGAAPTTLLVGEQPWEEGHPHGTPGIGLIENPAMARHPATGEWLLTWSANRWETQQYATGLATCAGPLGPCRRTTTTSPWLRTSVDPAITTTASFGGAGGMSFVVAPDGQLYVAFHAYRWTGRAPDDPRVGWVYRVDAATNGPGPRYRLVEFVGNQSTEAAVSEA